MEKQSTLLDVLDLEWVYDEYNEINNLSLLLSWSSDKQLEVLTGIWSHNAFVLHLTNAGECLGEDQ